MKHTEFAKTLFDSPYELLPKATDAQTALNILADHFLGMKNCRIDGYPATTGQWNSEVVHEILRRYPNGKIRRIRKGR